MSTKAAARKAMQEKVLQAAAKAEEQHQQAHKLVKERKFEEARKLWGLAAKEEHIGAMVCYGKCRFHGDCAPRICLKNGLNRRDTRTSWLQKLQ